MIVSKTPLKISFFSGGSDTPAFYKREDGSGLGLSSAFTVGLVNSLFKINNTDALKETIAKESVAIGGKLLGAGGGEFFVFYVKEDKREEVIHTIKNKTNCKIFPLKFYDEGTKIMSYE